MKTLIEYEAYCKNRNDWLVEKFPWIPFICMDEDYILIDGNLDNDGIAAIDELYKQEQYENTNRA